MRLETAFWIVPVLLLAALLYLGYAAFTSTHNADVSTPAVVSSAAFPKTIEQGGRKTLIPARPVRIVACNVGNADVLAAICAPARIGAVPAVVEQYAGAGAFYVQHREIKRFEKYDAETLLALQPDLVLASAFQDAAATEILIQRGVPVLRLEAFQTFAGIRASILTMGSAVGEEARAAALAQEFDRRLAAVEAAVAKLPKPCVLAYSNYGTGFMVGSGESMDEIIRRAGALNAAAESGVTGSQPCTFEQVLKFDPDYILVTGDKGLDSPQAQIVLGEPNLAGLRAVKERRIVVVPDRLFSAVSQYVVDAVETLAKQLHAEAFSADERRGSGFGVRGSGNSGGAFLAACGAPNPEPRTPNPKSGGAL